MSVFSGKLKDGIAYIQSRPIRFFAVGSVFFGVLFIILVPPFQIPDEYTHFTRSYEVSEFKSAEVKKGKNIDYLGSMMPESIYLTYKKTSLKLTPGAPDIAQAKKFSLGQSRDALGISLNPEKKIFYDTGSSPSYFPLLYAPQALAISVLKLFHSPVIIMLYATRLMGLLVWVVLVVIALRIAKPAGHLTALSAVLLLPMFVAQASASTDPLINGLLVLYVAGIMYYMTAKKQPTKLAVTGFISILTLMALSKPVYAIFGILFLLLSNKYKGLSKILFRCAVIIAPFILLGLWTTIAKHSGGPYYIDAIAISRAVPGEQVSYIIPNIFNFVEPFFNTLLLGWGDGVYVSLIGLFGKLDTPLPILFIIIGYLIALIAIFFGTEKREKPATHKYKTILMLSAVILYFGSVYLAMYVVSTPPHEKIITGIQGRYFLPLIPILVWLVSKNKITIKKTEYEALLTVLPVVLLMASVIVVWLRYHLVYPT